MASLGYNKKSAVKGMKQNSYIKTYEEQTTIHVQ